MDSLFRERYDDDNVVHRNLKTEFMSLWDEVIGSKSMITVIGATNRPQELDPAIQRRFERSYLIGLPDFNARKEIFQIVLQNTVLDKQDFDFSRAAELTESYSPSDIISLCKAACFIPYRELKSKKGKKIIRRSSEQVNAVIPSNLYNNEPFNNSNSNSTTNIDNNTPKIRGLRTSDIEDAASSVFPTAWSSKSYGELTKQQKPNTQQSNDFWYSNDMSNRSPDYDNDNDN